MKTITLLIVAIIGLTLIPVVSAEPINVGPGLCLPLPLNPINVQDARNWLTCMITGHWGNCFNAHELTDVFNDYQYVICVVMKVLDPN